MARVADIIALYNQSGRGDFEMTTPEQFAAIADRYEKEGGIQGPFPWGLAFSMLLYWEQRKGDERRHREKSIAEIQERLDAERDAELDADSGSASNWDSDWDWDAEVEAEEQEREHKYTEELPELEERKRKRIDAWLDDSATARRQKTMEAAI